MGFNLSETKANLRIFLFYFRKYRKFYLIGILSLVIVDGLEIFPPLLMKWAVDLLSEGKATAEALGKIAAIYMAVAGVQAFMRFLWRRYIVRTSMLSSNDMRNDLFVHISSLAPGFFKKKRVGDLVSLATNDIEAIRFALGPGALVMFDALFYFITIVPMMFYLSPKLALLTLPPLLLVPKFVRIMEMKIQKHFKIVQDRFSDLAAHCQESLGGVRIIKGAALEPFKEREFAGLGEQYVNANIKAAITQSTLNTFLELFVSISTTLLFVLGGALIIQEKITIGVFVAFQKYIQKMSWPMEAFGLGANIFQRSMASQKRVDEVMEEKPTILSTVSTETPVLFSTNTVPRITIQNLSFTYPGKDIPALKNISLTIEPGAKVGLAGGVGSGKSTLLGCLSRMEPIPHGAIFFNDKDVWDIPVEEVRKWIGIVPQEVFLFSQTIEDNILYGSEHFHSKNLSARRAHAELAAQNAVIHKEVERTVSGYASLLGERGVNLSGGQKQRLTIARALARDPKVLLLDDCLSAVDNETESALIQSLQKVQNSLVISSHRMSCMEKLDWIFVLQNGTLVEQGPPACLKSTSRLFTELYEKSARRELLGVQE